MIAVSGEMCARTYSWFLTVSVQMGFVAGFLRLHIHMEWC